MARPNQSPYKEQPLPNQNQKSQPKSDQKKLDKKPQNKSNQKPTNKAKSQGNNSDKSKPKPKGKSPVSGKQGRGKTSEEAAAEAKAIENRFSILDTGFHKHPVSRI